MKLLPYILLESLFTVVYPGTLLYHALQSRTVAACIVGIHELSFVE